MRLTNKLGLPQPIVKAVENDGYSKGDADISVTELQDPPQLRFLRHKHNDELEEDVSDRIWSLCGQVVHGILERADETGIAERRLHIMVDGWKVSGSMDRFVMKDGILQDYKFTTVYKLKNNTVPEEWVKQLNIYGEILRQHGDVVKGLQIIAILRDWSKREAERDISYPQRQIMVVKISLVDSSVVLEYIKERVALHQNAAKNGITPPCSKEDRWARDDVWAVMKKGQKRAVKLCATEVFAKEMVSTLGNNHYIEYREGESVRCKSYCPVAKFCPQYAKMQNVKGDE